MRPPDYTLESWLAQHSVVTRTNLNQMVKRDNVGAASKVCECLLRVEPFFALSDTHSVTQYIDDSSSCVAFKDITTVQLYLTTYLELLQEYYSMNL